MEYEDLLVTVKAPKIPHKTIVFADLRAMEDWNTKKVTVRATLGIAPDEYTIIEYPVWVAQFGYWNRGTVRKVMALVKKRFLVECKALGYPPSTWTRPLETSLFWER